MKQVYFHKLNDNPSIEEQVNAVSKVIDIAKVSDLVSPNDFVAIKTHVGEKGNTTHIKPQLIKPVSNIILEKSAFPFVTETATLYKCERENAVKHLYLANKHGFTIENTGAPFILSDGLLGNMETKVKIDKEMLDEVEVAQELKYTDVLITVSHPTGHMVAGLGATLKNLGMGMASRKGKMKQHSSMRPKVKGNCVLCKKCFDYCPKDAIYEKDSKAFIDEAKCIGCGECLTVCNFEAIAHNWGKDPSDLQKMMAEFAYGAVKDRKCFYINVLVDMTKECDCMGMEQHKAIRDIGIMGSYDPVALDRATLDITKKHSTDNLAMISHPEIDANVQLNHAEKIGLGSQSYEIVEI